MSNLIVNNRNDLKFNLCLDNYWDFFLHKGSDICSYMDNLSSNTLYDECLISYIDLTDNECLFDKFILSKDEYVYLNSNVTNNTLYNIGLCGVDNGIVRFQKDRITNEQFLNIFTKSTLDLNTNRLKLFEVSGNTMQYSYGLYYDEENGAKLNGGFFQGFFMTKCEEYKVLPFEIEDAWHFEVRLKKENFENDSRYELLNDKHPDNKGFFLYIGTRAENKWMLLYDKSLVEENTDYMDEEDSYLYEKSYNRKKSDYINSLDYIQAEPNFPYVIDGYFTEIGDKEPYKRLSFIADEYIDLSDYQCCNNSNNINYFGKGCLCGNSNQNKFEGDESYCKELKCPTCKETGIVKVGSCNNISDDCVDYLNYKNCCHYPSIKNNNCNNDSGCCRVPFITWRVDYYDSTNTIIKHTHPFNSECSSPIFLNHSDWLDENAFDLDNEYSIIDENYLQSDMDISNIVWETSDGIRLDLNEKIIETDNKFLLFDRTKTGYTVNNWEEGTKAYFSFSKNTFKDNLFLLMNRTKTGYTVNNIEELKVNSMQEYDYKKDLYNNALGFRITDNGKIGYRYLVKDCDTEDVGIIEFYSKEDLIQDDTWYTINIKIKKYGKQMRIFIYINGKLKLCSQYLPLLNLRELNEEYSKQESVPYNISLGGGSQGLADVILPNYQTIVEKVFPIEQYFAGTFIGYIKYFRFYNCSLEKRFIDNNYNYDLNY